MLFFLAKRLLQALIVMFVISLLAFSVQSKLGDPVQQLAGESVPKAIKMQLRKQLGLDDPFIIRYSRFIKGIVLHADFGKSYFYKRSTMSVILEKLMATLELVFIATVLIILISIPIGMYTAIHPKRKSSQLLLGASTIGISIPVFLTGIILIYIFAVKLQWLPSYGRGITKNIFGWQSGFFTVSGLAHLTLPSITLASLMLPLFIRLVRSEMLETLGLEYIRFAFAKGLPNRSIYFKHALKPVMLTLVTIGGVQIGIMVAFTILTESIFQWPGTGFLFLEAVNRSDITLLTTYIIFIGFVFVVINTAVDILYRFLNPTITVMEGKK